MRWQVLGQMTQEVAHALAGRSHQGRRHRRVERHVITAGHRGDLGRVRRAAEESQQGHVVHARTRGHVQPQRFRHPQRQPGRPQPVIHRLAGPQIRRQRQSDRQLRDPPRPDLIGHPSTLTGTRHSSVEIALVLLLGAASGCRYLGSDIIPYARVGRRRATTRSSSTIARRNVSQSSCWPTSCS